MTSEPLFGNLDDVSLRQAWTHEARGFTPWLAQNLDRLSKAIGIPLEHTGTEVAVESFAADILARNPLDDTNVLIENQLEEADHRHLGQILTYLAGLDVKMIVWVAPSFREAHLSAIRWLNEHTDDVFSFFAVRVRVVRIGDSPLAPLFDVLQQPSGWDRRLKEVARESRELSEIGVFRRRFWEHFAHRYPADTSARAGAASTRWRRLPELGLTVALFLANDKVGIYIRGMAGADPAETFSRLASASEQLETRLSVGIGEPGTEYPFLKALEIDSKNEANWDRMADWAKVEADRYESALRQLFGGTD